MSKIFISYSRKDEAFARELAASLSQYGADIWLDVKDIPAGMKWSTAIQQGLQTCEVLLLIISPDAMASTNVEDEWQYFLDQKKPVIPVLWRNTAIHFQLSRLQYINFSRIPYHEAFQRLLAELDRVASIKLMPKGTGQLPPLPQKSKWSWGWLGLLLIPVLIVGVILFALSQNGDEPEDAITASATPATLVAIVEDSPTPMEATDLPATEEPTSTPSPTTASTNSPAPTSTETSIPASDTPEPPTPAPVTSLTVEPHLTYAAHANQINDLTFSPDGLTLASGSADHTVRFWNPLEREAQGVYAINGLVNTLAYHHDGSYLAVGLDNGVIGLWATASAQQVQSLTTGNGAVSSLAFHAGSDLLAIGGQRLGFWDLTSVQIITRDPQQVTALAFVPDSLNLVIASQQNALSVLDAETESLQPLPATGMISYLAVSPAYIATVRRFSSSIELWQLPDGAIERTLTSEQGQIRALAFSADGNLLAAATAENDVLIWRVAEGGLAATLPVNQTVTSLAFSPDGQLLAAGDNAGTLTLWRLDD